MLLVVCAVRNPEKLDEPQLEYLESVGLRPSRLADAAETVELLADDFEVMPAAALLSGFRLLLPVIVSPPPDPFGLNC